MIGGSCMAGGVHVWGMGHTWLGGVCGWGCMAREEGHAWLGGMCDWGRIYMACGRRGACVAGHTLPCMVGKQVVHILLECLLV